MHVGHDYEFSGNNTILQTSPEFELDFLLFEVGLSSICGGKCHVLFFKIGLGLIMAMSFCHAPQ